MELIDHRAIDRVEAGEAVNAEEKDRVIELARIGMDAEVTIAKWRDLVGELKERIRHFEEGAEEFTQNHKKLLDERDELQGQISKVLDSLSIEQKAKADSLKELHELRQTFGMRYRADMRAIKMWQKETGEELKWPDKADLLIWLLKKNAAVRNDLMAALALVHTAAKQEGFSKEHGPLIAKLTKTYIDGEDRMEEAEKEASVYHGPHYYADATGWHWEKGSISAGPFPTGYAAQANFAQWELDNSASKEGEQP